MKRNRKVITISVGLIVLGSVAMTSGDNATYKLNTEPKDRLRLLEIQEINSEMFQDLVAKSGVVLTEDALFTILGPTISAEGVDTVTAPSMMPLP